MIVRVIVALGWLLLSVSVFAAEPGLSVRELGAVPDGETLCTEAIQKAIDRCHASGGGTVYFPPGKWLSGTLVLKSNVTLHLEAGATLLGSRDIEDYPVHVPKLRAYTDLYTNKSLIYAEGAENIGLVGRGTIDGQAKASQGKAYKPRPYLIRLIECKKIRVRDLTMKRPAMWTLHLLASEDIVIDGIRINAYPPMRNHNNDGIDLDSCRFARISNCHISTGDDAIVLKSTCPRPCEHVTVTNCVLRTRCNAFKMGTESVGGFRNITMSNCAIYKTLGSGIALDLVDGGDYDTVCVNNVTMLDGVGNAIFVRLGNRARPHWIARPGDKQSDAPPKPGMGTMRNIIISNVQASTVKNIGCMIAGLPGRPVKNVTLSNIRLQMAGGGTKKLAKRFNVPEDERGYPKPRAFGPLPSYGVYCRHVENVRLANVDLTTEKDDARPPVLCEDVRHLDLFGLLAKTGSEADCVVRLRQVDGALIHGCRLLGPIGRVIDDTEECRDIRVTGNAFDGSNDGVSLGASGR